MVVSKYPLVKKGEKKKKDLWLYHRITEGTKKKEREKGVGGSGTEYIYLQGQVAN